MTRDTFKAKGAPVGVEGLRRCGRCKREGDSPDCTRCGGTGWRRKCDDLDCAEHGCCGGHTCYVAPEEVPALAQQPAAVDGVRGLVAKWREEATAYVVRANEKDKSGGFRWAGWMRDELRSKAGVCKRHADELESALAAQQGGAK
nr:MAG TPA_asm: hypothetical protein [Caudoviricetes sp.]